MIDLEEIKARAEAATRGPWTYSMSGDLGTKAELRLIVRRHLAEPLGPMEPNWIPSNADMSFIKHARTDVPALIAEVEELRRENKAYGHRVGCLRYEAENERRRQMERLEKLAELEAEVERLNKENLSFHAQATEYYEETERSRDLFLRSQRQHREERRAEAGRAGYPKTLAKLLKFEAKLAAIRMAAEPVIKRAKEAWFPDESISDDEIRALAEATKEENG